MTEVRADFDRIALLPDVGWDANRQYHEYLVRHLPEQCGAALDVGCGTGAFSRLLAERASRVVALDLSPRMIEVAKKRSGRHDTYLTLPAIRWVCEKALPGARVRQHLLWRYSILWRKP